MENLYQIPSESCSDTERRVFWARVIADQSTSGLSMLRFCQLYCLKFTTFRGYKYLRKNTKAARLNASNVKRLKEASNNNEVAKLIPLQVIADVSANERPKDKVIDEVFTEIKIVFKNGHKLGLPLTVTEMQLLSIIKIVAGL